MKAARHNGKRKMTVLFLGRIAAMGGGGTQHGTTVTFILTSRTWTAALPVDFEPVLFPLTQGRETHCAVN